MPGLGVRPPSRPCVHQGHACPPSASGPHAGSGWPAALCRVSPSAPIRNRSNRRRAQPACGNGAPQGEPSGPRAHSSSYKRGGARQCWEAQNRFKDTPFVQEPGGWSRLLSPVPPAPRGQSPFLAGEGLARGQFQIHTPATVPWPCCSRLADALPVLRLLRCPSQTTPCLQGTLRGPSTARAWVSSERQHS